MGVDGVAVLLIVLTTLLGVIAALSSWNYNKAREGILRSFAVTADCGDRRLRSMVFSCLLFFEVSLGRCISIAFGV